jgi:preprotein translocase subunit SecD
LCIGIVSSVFTAVVGTRVVYDYLLARRRLVALSV